MIQTIKTLFFVLASLSALLFASSCQDDLKPLEQEMDFSVSCSPTYAHIEREEQLVNTQILVSEQEVECPRPTKYSASFTYDETLGTLHFLGKRVKTGTPIPLSSLTNLSLTYQAKQLVGNKIKVTITNDAPKAVSKEATWTINADDTYSIETSQEGEGKLEVRGAKDLKRVAAGTELTVSAEPADGWELVALTANKVDILSSKSFKVTENTTVRAVFTTENPKTYAVTLVKEGEGTVAISGADDLGAVVTGTKLTVSAEPADGWKLTDLTANGVDILSSKSFEVSENTAIWVTFTEENPMRRIHFLLQRSDLVSLYRGHSNFKLSDLEIVQKFLPKVETENGELLIPDLTSRTAQGEWNIFYPEVRVGTSVRFVLDEAAMSPLVATLTYAGTNYSNRSWRVGKVSTTFNLRYTLANGFAYLAYPSQTNDEHGYITVKPPYRPFKVLARYGGKESGSDGYDPIPPHEIVAVPTQSQVEIIPIGLNGWAYNGLRLTELDESQNPVNTDYTKDVLSIPINMKSSLITPHWYYKGQ